MHRLPTLRHLAILSASTLLLGLGACASGARSTSMVVNATTATAATPQDRAYHQVAVQHVQGGEKTNPLWVSNVSNAEFQTALQNSLSAAGYLAPEPGAASMQLTASLIKLQQPLAGFNMTVESHVRYTVTSTQSNAILFDDTVAASGTAKMGEALLGAERLRLANEAAMRANIEEFMRRFHGAVATMAGAEQPAVALAAAN